MNPSSVTLDGRTLRKQTRTTRFTATIISYNHVDRTAIVAPVVSGPVTSYSQPIRISPVVERLETVLKPGNKVVLERLTGRRLQITDVVRGPFDMGRVPLPGDHVDLGGATTDIRFAPNYPAAGTVSWTDGYISWNGQTIAVGSGQTSWPYIYWTVGAATLTPSLGVLSQNATRWLMAHFASGQVTVFPLRLHGQGIVPGTVTSGAMNINRLSDLHRDLGSVSGSAQVVQGTLSVSGATVTLTGGTWHFGATNAVTVQGTATFSGATTVYTGGTVTFSGGSIVYSGTTVTVSGGTWDFVGAGNTQNYSGSTIQLTGCTYWASGGTLSIWNATQSNFMAYSWKNRNFTLSGGTFANIWYLGNN